MKPKRKSKTRAGRGRNTVRRPEKNGSGKAASAMRRRVRLDYPREGDVISSSGYSFRIDAPESAGAVEIRIADGTWRSCRKASGYWWYDWSGYRSGPYQAVARIRPQNGEDTTSRVRDFQVKLD